LKRGSFSGDQPTVTDSARCQDFCKKFRDGMKLCNYTHAQGGDLAVRRHNKKTESATRMRGQFMEEYLTARQLSQRIKMAPGTIRNLVWKGVFEQNIHYVKPTARKTLFVWSQVEAWLFRRGPAERRNAENPGGLISI